MSDIPESFSPPSGKQVVLILCGLIGSGKSTFAQALEETFPEFIRCNQDDLGDRRQVENLARASLRNGSFACIDRTNFDPSQRAHWIKIAREIPGTLIWVIVFDTPKDICAARLRTRTEHPTIKNPEDALSILERFSSQYRAPSANEGYDRIIYLQPSEQEASYSRSSLAAILRRVRDAPSTAASVGPAVSQPSTRGSPYSRGGGFRGTRGRGGGHHGAYRGAGSAPARGMNRWGAFSGQGQIQNEPPTFNSQTQHESVPESQSVADSGSPPEPNT
ncbi:P-loop containing nucleoside triphosphate hydrolase protein [Mycena rosella]|uniref:P-loop containing nucleoside triphosphate hydrolase protein n=1 Tax=Mycena rosella TaxID=1033263 RepID=A0AAD7GHD2_MYCRO|nr:P-loop containing nucleoside triphosphate hydrolase protein [Mycena rosella]